MTGSSSKKSPSAWLASEGVADWLHAAAAIANGWDRDQSLVLTKQEYADAIERAANVGVK